MFISKAHDTFSTFESFYVTVWDHVSFEMWASFEGFIAVFLFADIGTGLGMTFGHVAVEMTEFFEGFLAELADMGLLVGKIW